MIKESKPINIPSRPPWTSTGFILRKGVKYDFKTVGTWTDWTIECDADGFTRWYLAPFAPFRRSSHNNWFALMGSVDKKEYFLIGRSQSGFIAPADGELHCFANDVPWMYRNNKESIDLIILSHE